MRKFYFIIISCIVISLLIFSTMPKIADASDVNSPATHVVKKGDTLWDICELYYKDSELWPQLWSLNPFVTNPHLLKEGDIIKLFGGADALSEAATKPSKGELYAKTGVQREHQREYINLKSIINTDYLGRLTADAFNPIATLVADDKGRRLISTGDKVFIKPTGDQSFAPGDILYVYSITSYDKKFLKNTEFDLISIKGLIRITGKSDNLYEGRVLKSRMALEENDPIVKLNTLSYYIELTEPKEATKGTVIGLDGLNHVMLSTSAIVYLDKGKEHGVSRGNVFALKKDHHKAASHNIQPREVGYVIVLESYDYLSMGVVVKLEEEVFLGAKVDSLKTESAVKVINHLPNVISKY